MSKNVEKFFLTRAKKRRHRALCAFVFMVTVYHGKSDLSSRWNPNLMILPFSGPKKPMVMRFFGFCQNVAKWILAGIRPHFPASFHNFSTLNIQINTYVGAGKIPPAIHSQRLCHPERSRGISWFSPAQRSGDPSTALGMTFKGGVKPRPYEMDNLNIISFPGWRRCGWAGTSE